jgi:hypothetical protein
MGPATMTAARTSALRTVLVVAPAGADGDDGVAELSARPDLRVRRAAAAGVEAALRDGAVRLLVAAPALETSAVTALLAARDRLRPELPVLVVRHRKADEPEGWIQRGVGVLRCPLLPRALSRSVDVVLGLDLHGRVPARREGR